jgi:NitT/TauT family transport system ATP-binding protein
VSRRFVTGNGVVGALERIDLVVEPGEFLCVLGPSGCGKSTLLSLAAGLEQPDEGRVLLGEEPVGPPGPDRVVIFQEAALFPWLSVEENVAFGLRITGIPPGRCREIAREHLRLVHLSRFARSAVHELSGGMKQRVALARGLALDPEILLMDEPFAALDAQTRDLLHEELQAIWERTRKTIVFVTHNVREAACLGGRIVVLTARPGRVKRTFRVELPRPRQIEDPALMTLVQPILLDLRAEVEQAAREERDPA